MRYQLLLSRTLPENPNSRAARQGILRPVCNQNVYYVFCESKLHDPLLGQMNRLYVCALYFLRLIFLLSSHLHVCFVSGFFPSGFLRKIL